MNNPYNCGENAFILGARFRQWVSANHMQNDRERHLPRIEFRAIDQCSRVVHRQAITVFRFGLAYFGHQNFFHLQFIFATDGGDKARENDYRFDHLPMEKGRKTKEEKNDYYLWSWSLICCVQPQWDGTYWHFCAFPVINRRTLIVLNKHRVLAVFMSGTRFSLANIIIYSAFISGGSKFLFFTFFGENWKVEKREKRAQRENWLDHETKLC